MEPDTVLVIETSVFCFILYSCLTVEYRFEKA